MSQVKARIAPWVGRVVTVEMPEDVARTLLSLCRNIAGDESHTYRRHTDRLYDALERIIDRPAEERFTGSVVAQSLL